MFTPIYCCLCFYDLEKYFPYFFPTILQPHFSHSLKRLLTNLKKGIMRKIIFLLTVVLLGTTAQSQVPPQCEFVEAVVQINSGTCPDGPSLDVDLLFFPNDYEIQEVLVVITNLGTNTETLLHFPNPQAAPGEIIGLTQQTPPLSAGDEYRVEMIIHSLNGDVVCPVSGSPLVIPLCSSLDQDRDGFTADVDCNDKNSSIFPGATEICNHLDDNCNSSVDENVNFTYYWDEDGDNFGDPSRPVASCSSVPTNKLSDNNLDCDDTAPNINPGTTEVCGNGVDDNCSGDIDEGCSCPDEDNDDFCDIDDLCPGFDDSVDADSDGVPDGCDNCPSLSNPNQEQDEDCDGVPTIEDCNDFDANIGSSANDADCDGVPTSEDCDDNDSSVTTSNINDADCDGVPTGEDCDDNDPSITSSTVGDADCDGYLAADDCDDNNPDVNPGTIETCGNDLDDNCDTVVDENCENCSDVDSDGICDAEDICPAIANPAQEPDKDCDGLPTALDCNDNDASATARLDEDSDYDGVADCNDQEVYSPCPLLVDIKGVSVDSDRDGTPNCQDLCPNDRTSTEEPCPCTSTKDSDGDGVLDCFDLEIRSTCPGDVDSSGVSNDEDRDGVDNCEDVCHMGDDKIDVDRDKIPDACDLSLDVRGEPICHLGQNGTSRTIFVSPQQKARHLSHGDQPGPCTSVTLDPQAGAPTVTTLASEDVILYPNPATQELNVQVKVKLSSGAVLGIYDLKGNLYVQTSVEGGGTYTFELDSRFIAGVYFVKISDGNSEFSKSFIVND